MSVSLHIPYGDGESNTVKFTENSLYGLMSNYYSGLQMKLIGYSGNYWYATIDDAFYRVEFTKDSNGNPNITYTATYGSADCGIMLNDTLIFASIESTRRNYNLVLYTYNGSFTKLATFAGIGDSQQYVTGIVPMNVDNSLVCIKYGDRSGNRIYYCILDMSDIKNIKLIKDKAYRVAGNGYLNKNHYYEMDTRFSTSTLYGADYYLYDYRYIYNDDFSGGKIGQSTLLLHLTDTTDHAYGDGGFAPLIRQNRVDSICLPIIPSLSPFETPHYITNFTYISGDVTSDTFTVNTLSCHNISVGSDSIYSVDISLSKKPFPFLILTTGKVTGTGGEYTVSGTKIYILDTKSFSTGDDGFPVLDIVI